MNRSMGLFGKKDFTVTPRSAERERRDTDVTVRVLACGVCGTDVHFLRDCPDDMPMGHEISAQVIEIGARVTRVKKGDLVVVEDVTLCGACERCKSGESFLCQSGLTLGGQPGMSDFLTVDERMLHVFTDIDPVQASMTEPLAVAVGIVKAAAVGAATSVLICGAGPIGLLCCAYARYIGAPKIVFLARGKSREQTKKRVRAALEYGADDVFYTDQEDYDKELTKKHGLFDRVLLTGSPSFTGEALNLTAYGGTVLAAGVTFREDAGSLIDVNRMVFRKVNLLTFLAEPASNFPLALRLIARRAIDVSPIITHTFRMEDFHLLRRLYAQDSGVIKAVMTGQ